MQKLCTEDHSTYSKYQAYCDYDSKTAYENPDDSFGLPCSYILAREIYRCLIQ